MRTFNHEFRRLGAKVAALFIGLSALAWAQPPALFHYQGRLTSSGGVPITTLQPVTFSLWLGGTAAAANSGTQLYSEQTSIQPGAGGLFEFNIGSGANKTGSLSPSGFNTAQPIYIQVAVGTPSNVLLPRAQMTSVGYSFLAGTAATAAYASNAGTPQVTSVADLTGGNVVIGDLLQLSGAGLTGAVVFVGGQKAPIKSQTDTQIVCQVPAGIPMGLNPVAVALNGNASALSSVVAANVDVHRLLVHISPGSDPQVTIVDGETLTQVTQINLNQVLGSDATIPSLQAAFANQGSLLLIPSNQNGNIYAIDLTANPPRLVTSTPFFSGASRASAVTVSPDDTLMVVSDTTNSDLRTIPFVIASGSVNFPPYTANTIFGTSYDSFYDSTNAYFRPSGFSGPRGSTFVGNHMLMVSSSNGYLYAFRRTPGTRYFSVPPSAYFSYSGVNIVNQVLVGSTPFALRATSDQTRILATLASGSVLGFFTAPEGFSPTGFHFAAGANPLQVAIAPDNQTVLVADRNAASTPNMLHVFNMSGGTVNVAGDLIGPLPLSGPREDFQLAAIEPVTGKLVAVGTDDSTIHLFQRDGGVLTELKALSTSVYTGRSTYELEFQP